MKDFDGIVIFIVISFIACALFFSIIAGVKKAFNVKPAEKNRVNTSQLLKEQQERMEETRRKQEQLRLDMRQKMQDYKNRSR